MAKFEKDSAIVVLYDTAEFKKLNKATKGQLADAVEGKEEDTSFEIEVTYPVGGVAKSIVVVATEAKTNKDWREFGSKYASKFCCKVANLYFDMLTDYNDSVYEGAMLALHRSVTYKTKESDTTDLAVHIEFDESTENLNESVCIARDLVTMPGNKLYPEEYADRISSMLTPLGVTVKVYSQRQLERMGFDLLLSVGQGSENDSYVVVMEWLNGGNAPTKAYVGKGVCFDTGGISLKPSANMGDMKTDMGGSAAVVGAMHAIATHNLKENIVGIVGLVENMPDGKSVKPGDVVTSLSGLTVENLNTDAEGRLVLADILTHVQNEYDPSLVVDLATLTGAILVSLGHEMAGLFTNSSELSNTISTVGDAAGEGFWRMPMGKVWNEMIDSEVADMQNIGGRFGGSTTAAEFLYRFVDSKRAWAHLDIAGVASTTKSTGTGFGVRTLFNLAQEDVARFEVDEDMDY